MEVVVSYVATWQVVWYRRVRQWEGGGEPHPQGL